MRPLTVIERGNSQWNVSRRSVLSAKRFSNPNATAARTEGRYFDVA
jgi:hypothetical protein